VKSGPGDNILLFLIAKRKGTAGREKSLRKNGFNEQSRRHIGQKQGVDTHRATEMWPAGGKGRRDHETYENPSYRGVTVSILGA